MTKEQRQAQRQHRKTLDMDILRAGMVLQSLMRDRASYDYAGTCELVGAIAETLQHAIDKYKKEEE